MGKPRNIKELLGIDIDFLYQNSEFKTDLIIDKSDNRNFMLFDLNSKFLEIFDQYQISIFGGKASHLEFLCKSQNSDRISKLIELIVCEYGTDENNQNSADWNSSKYMTWWFKNAKHEQTFDEPDNTEELYYGIMIDGMNENQMTLAIIEYNNIDHKLNKKNWLQQRV